MEEKKTQIELYFNRNFFKISSSQKFGAFCNNRKATPKIQYRYMDR